MTVLEKSEWLHREVRRAALSTDVGEARFTQLALDIARFQYEHCPSYQRLVDALGVHTLDSVETLPAVTADALRVRRFSVHGPSADTHCFHTSGTSSSRTGRHYFRTTRTYQELSVRYGRERLLGGTLSPFTVLAIAPAPQVQVHSSLGFMMNAFAEAFDGRDLPGDAPGGRWFFNDQTLDLPALRAAVEVAYARAEPVLLLTTSFAAVHLLAALGGERMPLPPDSVVMTTGGYKGRVQELHPGTLRQQLADALHLRDSQIIAEYGMTELSSQLYAAGEGMNGDGVYCAPPWLRVTPVDPITFEAVGVGEPGIARFVDLANVDSTVCILTQDLVQQEGAGIRLLGRRPGAELRGCSLSFESVVG